MTVEDLEVAIDKLILESGLSDHEAGEILEAIAYRYRDQDPPAPE